MDETSHRKGHTYLTVVVDHERHRVVWARDGVGGDVFDLFFQQLTEEQKASIRVVAGDGARWIDSCVGRWCPNAERVLDGFHIVSWMTGALDKVRKRLWNQARRGGDEKTTKRMRDVKYTVLKNPDQLTELQDETLTALRNTDPKGRLYRAWQLKELSRTLLKHPLDQARDELNHRVFRASHSRIPEITELARKIRRRRPDILRTIELGYSNARPEAFNNRIKTTIRMAYGFHHVDNLISLIMLRCGGLDIRLPQPRTQPTKTTEASQITSSFVICRASLIVAQSAVIAKTRQVPISMTTVQPLAPLLAKPLAAMEPRMIAATIAVTSEPRSSPISPLRMLTLADSMATPRASTIMLANAGRREPSPVNSA